MIRHGHNRRGKRTSEYRAFHTAKQRCQNRNDKHFKYYGKRGIKFLFKSFPEFLQEVGRRPEGRWLDRIDNDGNYEPGNLRWATHSESLKNRRMTPKRLRALRKMTPKKLRACLRNLILASRVRTRKMTPQWLKACRRNIMLAQRAPYRMTAKRLAACRRNIVLATKYTKRDPVTGRYYGIKRH
jgi:hypothetical protein